MTHAKNRKNPDATFKQGDDLPILEATLKDALGVGIDLSSTGLSVSLHMRQSGSTVLDIDSTCGIVNATGGQISYAWSTGDLDDAGDWLAEFEILYANGKKLTVPNDDEADLHIREQLG